ENVLERTMLFAEGPAIRAKDLPREMSGAVPEKPLEVSSSKPTEPPKPGSLKEMVRQETERLERELIQRALDETGGNVTQAARKLKISRKSLQTKMKEFGLRDQTRGD